MFDKSDMLNRKPKCLFCFPLETGCFIFGAFSSVISGLCVLALCLVLTRVTGEMRSFSTNADSDDELYYFQSRAQDLVTSYVYVTLLYLFAITMFIFSVFLCYGVHKRRSGFVKAYLIYGIILTIVEMLAAIGYSWLQEDVVGGSLMLIGCGIYSLLLLMVQRTYEFFRAEKTHDEQLLDSQPVLKA